MDYNMGIQKKQDKLDNSRAMLNDLYFRVVGIVRFLFLYHFPKDYYFLRLQIRHPSIV